MRFTTPVLAALLLLANFAVAQDDPKKDGPKAENNPKKPETAQVVRLDAANLRHWIEQLMQDDQEKRDEALKALRELPPVSWEQLSAALGSGLIRTDQNGSVTLLVGPDHANEVIQGSWSDDGSTTSYTLRSKGTGRYALTGEKKDQGGETTKFSDEGTMADLQKRHEFLKGKMVMRFPFGLMESRLKLKTKNYQVSEGTETIKSLGIKVRRPGGDLAYHLYLPKDVGFVIDSVEEGSRAEKLGLEPFDVLTKIDGAWIEKESQLEVRGGTVEFVRRAKVRRAKLE